MKSHHLPPASPSTRKGTEEGTLLQGVANAYLMKAQQAENPNMQRTIVTMLVLSIICLPLSFGTLNNKNTSNILYSFKVTPYIVCKERNKSTD